MFWQKSETHAVPSACSRWPPVGSGALRSNTPMLSSPRKPPSKRFLPKRSLRFTHQLKFNISLAKDLLRNSRSASPLSACSVRYKKMVAHACTGGLTSLKFVSRDLTSRMQEELLQHQVELCFREIHIDRRE